jgi:hypothetical protein
VGWKPFFKRRLLGFALAVVEPVTDDTGADPADGLARPLFWLRHGFNESYQPAPSDLAFEGNPEVVRTFENVVFGVAMEGGAALLVNTGAPFVRDQLPVRIRHRYFLLFVLALQQRFGAIFLAERIARIGPARGHAEGAVYEDALVARVTRLREEVFDFKTRGWFADVGTMRMYTEVYRRWKEVLLTDPLVEEIKSEVQELDDYLRRAQLRRERARERREQVAAVRQDREAQRQSRALEILSYYLLPLTIVTSFGGINYEFIVTHGGWWWLAGAVAVGGVLTILVRRRLRRDA